ncbi:hypothetical protein PG999_005533 [Apiospora kogelbergensis]|uniref:Uncharacterized protein n=1 Tax=Apiospora kogelbergensis TaxID=1337665 RepID=A0AAW0R2G6_9PEZI
MQLMIDFRTPHTTVPVGTTVSLANTTIVPAYEVALEFHEFHLLIRLSGLLVSLARRILRSDRRKIGFEDVLDASQHSCSLAGVVKDLASFLKASSGLAAHFLHIPLGACAITACVLDDLATTAKGFLLDIGCLFIRLLGSGMSLFNGLRSLHLGLLLHLLCLSSSSYNTPDVLFRNFNNDLLIVRHMLGRLGGGQLLTAAVILGTRVAGRLLDGIGSTAAGGFRLLGRCAGVGGLPDGSRSVDLALHSLPSLAPLSLPILDCLKLGRSGELLALGGLGGGGSVHGSLLCASGISGRANGRMRSEVGTRVPTQKGSDFLGLGCHDGILAD